MSPKIMVAILLIALAVVAFAYEGITYKTRGNAVDIGPLQVTTERTHRIPLPPIAGAIALLGGITLLVVERKRFSHATAH